ncbi:unnamed protein product [Diabrotica balteata]|uniref:LIM zinc-binding domain-containing protein n=1 Tax=Diabrotica balteata TaxID=107213 RepID=A0A9N9SX57_DIABA|nr:unnamed protein product [Diabrotica balteata]
MTCARCGYGVLKAEDQIVMTKVWHKCCFRCCNCGNILSTSSARFFQGDLFCERCHGFVLNDLENFTSNPECRPHKAVSLPSCICTDDEKQMKIKTVPSVKSHKSNDIEISAEAKQGVLEKPKSCSCLPDISKDRYHCFDFPLPREVANYLNRNGMKKKDIHEYHKAGYLEETPFSIPRMAKRCPRITVRTLSPPRRGCCFRRHNAPPRLFVQCDRYTDPTRPVSCCHNRRNSPRRRNHSPAKRGPPCNCHLEPQYHRHKCRKSPPEQDCYSNTDEASHDKYKLCSGCNICCNYHKCPKCREYHHNNNDCPVFIKHSDYTEENRKEECPGFTDFSDHTGEKNDKEYSSGIQCLCCPIHNKKPYNNFEKIDQDSKFCFCGNVMPCCCKISQVRDECRSNCVRCKRKVYAAEKIYISSGPFHTSCFSCYCCNKLLDVRHVYEHKGEIYCKNCYNSFTGNQYYGYGS